MADEAMANDNTGAETVETTEQTTEQTTETTTETTEQNEQTTEQSTEQAETIDTFADYKPDLPNGVNEEILAEALPVFKELGLNPDQANKIMPIADKLVQSTVAKVVEDINNTCQANYDEVMDLIKNNRKDGGSQAFDKNMGQINALLKKYGDDNTPEQFHTALTALAGFDKEAVKPFFVALSKIARDAADDTTILGTQKPQETTMYPGLPKGARFK